MSSKITEDDIITSSGKYPERAKQATALVRSNARIVAAKANMALDELGYTGPRIISSGFRPAIVNAAVGGAKKSLHMQGLAIDFVGQEIGLLVRSHPNGPEILRKHKIFQESLEHTKNWSHWDLGERADRPSREFKI